jgi:hypothetical protein
MTPLDEFGWYWTILRNRARRTSGSPGDHASPRFPPEPPFSDCGMRVKEPALFSFVRSPPEAFLPPRPRFHAASARRCCQGWPRFSGHRRLGLGSVEHDGMLECRGRQCLLSWYQAPAGSPFSPWSGVVPATPWHSTLASPNVARVLTIKSDGMQAAPRVSCSLVPAGTRILSSRRYLHQLTFMLRRRLRPALQSGTFLLKATCDA